MKKSLFNFSLILLLLVFIRPAAANVSLLVLGDSLSAGYGISEGDTWVAEIQRQWEQEQPDYQIINASISGDTTQGALNRLSSVIDRHQPDAVFIELGGNDGLRGFAIESIRNNLSEMIDYLHGRGIYVALSQIEIPPNMGRRYTSSFNAVFREVAENHEVTLVPFFMLEIAIDSDLMQSDGIHPNLDAQPVIAEIMEPELRQILDRVKQL
ncbi:arylesterase [Aliidiomarina minuta]|uniref:Arylesterase n=2 Tax=Aliidiomarina minuta TaxID=880057 RepID=A0A432WAG6_9GAMM|nr:arylesterase [Aliidiomarina minuta]